MTARFTGGGARTGRDTTVDLSVVADTATETDDYTAPSTLPTLTIPRNSLTGAATFVLTVVDDEDPEPAERLRVHGVSDLPVDDAAITIAANDGGGGGGGGGGATTARSGQERGGGGGGGDLEMRPQNSDAWEKTGNMVFTVELSGASSDPVTVRWTTASRTAVAGADYTASSGTLTIPAGSRSGQFEVPILNDLMDEPDETFLVRFDQPRGAGLAAVEAVGTIHDDDDAPQLFIEDVSAAEGGGRLGFLVFLASDSEQDGPCGLRDPGWFRDVGRRLPAGLRNARDSAREHRGADLGDASRRRARRGGRNRRNGVDSAAPRRGGGFPGGRNHRGR